MLISLSSFPVLILYFCIFMEEKIISDYNYHEQLSCIQVWSHQFLSQRKLRVHWANEEIAREIPREVFI